MFALFSPRVSTLSIRTGVLSIFNEASTHTRVRSRAFFETDLQRDYCNYGNFRWKCVVFGYRYFLTE